MCRARKNKGFTNVRIVLILLMVFIHNNLSPQSDINTLKAVAIEKIALFIPGLQAPYQTRNLPLEY